MTKSQINEQDVYMAATIALDGFNIHFKPIILMATNKYEAIGVALVSCQEDYPACHRHQVHVESIVRAIVDSGKVDAWRGRKYIDEQEEQLTICPKPIGKWNKTMAALTKLHTVYCRYGSDDGLVRDILVELMEAYDRWLD